MNGKERIRRIMNHQPVDRVGIFEHFWADTIQVWTKQGHIPEGESAAAHFEYDCQECRPLKMVADLDAGERILSRDERSEIYLDGNGVTMRRFTDHVATPEHIAFRVEEREQWEPLKALLKPGRRRIDFASYEAVKKEADEAGRFFLFRAFSVFELMQSLCGHENLLVGMALDPEWVSDMANTYAALTVQLAEMLFEEKGYPDGIWLYEDMGYKGSPFMSPKMYCELLQPAHKIITAFAKKHNLPVIMHSCGFVEPSYPHLIEAGITCMQALEVKAGMDLLEIEEKYGEYLCFMGGIDVRALITNDCAKIDRELESKVPLVKHRNNYIVHTDHSVPSSVEYEKYRYFIRKALELGTCDPTLA